MAKFWFVSAPLFSHTDWGGFLKTAHILKSQGHEVAWVSAEGLRRAVEVAKLNFHAIPETGWLWPPPPAPDLSSIPPAEAVMLRYRRALDTWLSEELVGKAVESLVALANEAGKPDVIVTDPFLSAAAIGAEILDVPLAVCGWPAQRDLRDDHLFPIQKSLGKESQDRLARLYEQFGTRGKYFAKGPTPSILSPHLHVSYFSPTWYHADTGNLLPQTLFVGGKPTPPADPSPQWLADISANAPLALVTLGSTFTGDLGFFSWAAHAATRVGLIPIVVIGKNPIEPEKKAELKAALPKNTRLLTWVSFEHVLPRTKLMIHHGGMGTTHAAVVHGVVQMVVPHAADQRGQARRVAQAKVGLNLTAHDVRQGALLEGAKALTADTAIQQNAHDLAAEFASLGGPKMAAEALVRLTLS